MTAASNSCCGRPASKVVLFGAKVSASWSGRKSRPPRGPPSLPPPRHGSPQHRRRVLPGAMMGPRRPQPPNLGVETHVVKVRVLAEHLEHPGQGRFAAPGDLAQVVGLEAGESRHAPKPMNWAQCRNRPSAASRRPKTPRARSSSSPPAWAPAGRRNLPAWSSPLSTSKPPCSSFAAHGRS